MKRRGVSKRQRNEAAFYCALMASSSLNQWPLSDSEIVATSGISWGSARLGRSAWRAVVDLLNPDDITDNSLDAEAESLLRSGWSLGDKL